MIKRTTTALLGLFLCASLWAGPVENFLSRLFPSGSDSQRFKIVLTQGTAPEYFTLGCDGNIITVKGNSLSALTTGINWYLHHYAGVDLTWDCMTAKLPRKLPVVKDEKHEVSVPLRYYLNYCTYSYSMAFWGWERWQREIDWMALHGVNMPLALVGTGSVWKAVLEHYGYTLDGINNFVAGPAFQAWFLMNNMTGWGGPNTANWYSTQEELQDSILTRMTSLGMTPVLPGYAGMVPVDLVDNLPAGWQKEDILSSGGWCGYTRPSFINNTQRLKEFASVYYHKQDSLFGRYCTTHYYSMDPFHEGSAPKGITSTDASIKAIYDAVKAHDAQAVWVAQSWGGNPTQSLLNMVPQKELVVLDLFSEGAPKWSKEGSYNGHPWIFCMLHNFGGRTPMHGRIAALIEGFYNATSSSTVNPPVGLGATPEGIENNPVMYELLFELPWSRTITRENWVKDYVFMRYGKHNRALEKAWSMLAASIYDCRTQQHGPSESILCSRPALQVNAVSTWCSAIIYWNTDTLVEAARLFLSVKNDFKNNPHFRYDLVDVVHQTLSDYATPLLARIKAAKEAGDPKLGELTNRYLQLILDQDSLLGTHSAFTMGRWVEEARALGATPAEKDWYERNARYQVTTWGPLVAANDGGLRDYSNREWSGLLKDYYYPRWRAFFEGGCKPMSGNEWCTRFELPYADGAIIPYGSYRNTVKGDCISLSAALFHKYYGYIEY